MTSVDVREADKRVADTLAELRKKLATVSSTKAKPVVPQNQRTVTVAASEQVDKEMLPIPAPLAQIMPGGGLARGSVVAVDGARSVLVSIIAEITASGGYVAVVGLPHLSLHAVEEMGGDLSHVAVVSGQGDPGVFDPGRSPVRFDPVEVAAVLLDGLDLVVVGLGGVSVPPSRARAVMARARAKGSTLMVTDGRWSGVQATLSAQVADYRHLPFRAAGHGRISGLSLSVQARGRGTRVTETRIDVVHADDRVRLVAARPVGAVADAAPVTATGGLTIAVAN
ncbi:hypothetical protein [Williamsia sp. Leaf354]|uniref:hypothetical protein n=1 Tax=Williamsia sp. Leaf354 TaxID=1736349 RepID=UPI000A4FE691|nr:hypothetical protein [Williamsia sp. Leaf354]